MLPERTLNLLYLLPRATEDTDPDTHRIYTLNGVTVAIPLDAPTPDELLNLVKESPDKARERLRKVGFKEALVEALITYNQEMIEEMELVEMTESLLKLDKQRLRDAIFGSAK